MPVVFSPPIRQLTTRRTQLVCAPRGSALQAEDGFTLIEMLVAAVLTMVIATAAAQLLSVGSNSQARN